VAARAVDVRDEVRKARCRARATIPALAVIGDDVIGVFGPLPDRKPEAKDERALALLLEAPTSCGRFATGARPRRRVRCQLDRLRRGGDARIANPLADVDVIADPRHRSGTRLP